MYLDVDDRRKRKKNEIKRWHLNVYILIYSWEEIRFLGQRTDKLFTQQSQPWFPVVQAPTAGQMTARGTFHRDEFGPQERNWAIMNLRAYLGQLCQLLVFPLEKERERPYLLKVNRFSLGRQRFLRIIILRLQADGSREDVSKALRRSLFFHFQGLFAIQPSFNPNSSNIFLRKPWPYINTNIFTEDCFVTITRNAGPWQSWVTTRRQKLASLVCKMENLPFNDFASPRWENSLRKVLKYCQVNSRAGVCDHMRLDSTSSCLTLAVKPTSRNSIPAAFSNIKGPLELDQRVISVHCWSHQPQIEFTTFSSLFP